METLDGDVADEARCLCGRLLARLTQQGIELKCARCRRVVLIEWSRVRDDRKLGDV